MARRTADLAGSTGGGPEERVTRPGPGRWPLRAGRRRPVGARLVAAGFTVVGGVVGLAQAAHAAGPDLNGDRISWDSHFPCTDGGGVYVSAHGSYNAPYAGAYRLRYVLERSDGSRLGISPVRDWSIGGPYDALRFPTWYTSSGYTGQAHAVAYAFRWNGSFYALMARETIPCI